MAANAEVTVGPTPARRHRERLWAWIPALALLLALFAAAPASAKDYTVTSTADTVDGNLADGECQTAGGVCTLRAAVQQANMRSGSDTITVPGGVYTIRETGVVAPSAPGGLGFDPVPYEDWEGDFDIAGPLTITGGGAGVTIVDGGAAPFGAPEQTAVDRLFEIHPTAGNVTISNLTAREGWSADEGGGILNRSAGTVRLNDMVVRDSVAGAYGGGIFNAGPLDGICPVTCPVGSGRLELNRTKLIGNSTVGEGGAVFTTESTFVVTGRSSARSELLNNRSGEGGAIHHGGELTGTGSRSRVDVSHALLKGNVSDGDGGAIYNGHEGDLVVTDAEFEDNLAWDSGGAIDTGGKTGATITRTTFDANRSGGQAGAVNAHGERALTLTDSIFTHNAAGVGLIDELGQFHEGTGGAGAISVDGSGSATVLRSRFDDNHAHAEGGAIAIEALGTVLIADSQVSGNETDTHGGGIQNGGMRVTLRQLEISGNTAFESGGGINNEGSGEFLVDRSMISRNTALDGGGIMNAADAVSKVAGSTLWDNRARNAGGGFSHSSDAETDIENSTLSGNAALVNGGGLYVDADAGLHVVSSTITQNRAPAGSGVGAPIESVNFPIEPSLGAIFRNTIVAGNRLSGDCNAAWGSEGGNFDGGTDCYFRGSRDRVNVDPRLDALADNGGVTMTHAPQPSSLAIDGGVNETFTLVEGATVRCPEQDQRRSARPKNGICDVGAHEYDGPFPAPDDDAPTATIDPDAPLNTGEFAEFEFTGSDPGNRTPPDELSFECRVLVVDPTDPPDPPDPTEPPDPLDPELWWHGCASGWPGDSLQLEEGPSQLQVRAIDRAGNVGEADTHDFMGGMDTTAPETYITGGPPLNAAGETTRNSAVFTFMAEDPETLDPTLFEYECRIDGGDWAAVECLNPMGYTGLSVGPHRFQVRAIDEGDNIDASPATFNWTIVLPTNCDEANVTIGADADAMVDESLPITNFGLEESLSVRSGLASDNSRALVRFPVPEQLPANCQLVSAKLRLHADAEPGRTLEAHRITETWAEMNATWMNQPGTAGTPAEADSGMGYREWDVTEHVEHMLTNANSDHGWLIRDGAEEDPEGAETTFSSRDTIAEPPAVPRLVLRFEGGSSEPPPAPPSGPLTPTYIECGDRITESIRVLNDISCEETDGLIVGAGDIIIDLDGFTIDGPDPILTGNEENLTAGIRNGGHENVIIRGGKIQQFGHGVSLLAGTRFNTVTGMTLERNALSGVELWDADDGRYGNEIVHNDFAGNTDGVLLTAGSEATLVKDNLFNGQVGVAVHMIDASRNRIVENDVSGIPIDPNLDSDGGFRLESSTDNLILGNTLVESGDGGLVIDSGSHRNRAELNSFSRAGDAGIVVQESDGNELVGNVSHLGSDAGISLSHADRTTVLDNDVRFNPTGIDASESNDSLIRLNRAQFAGGEGILVDNSLRTLITENIANGTRAAGIDVRGDALDPVTGDPLDGNTIRGNTTNGNLGDGIVVAAGHTVADNVAHHNAGFGIDGAESSPDEAGVIDGGGNVAAGNGEPEQCRGVACGTGNPGAPEDYTDLTPPDTQVDSGPADGISGELPQVLRFSGTDNVAPETALRYECRLDAPEDPVIPPEPPEPPEPGDPPEVPEPPVTEHWEECASPVRFAQMFSGEHRFEVRATDPSDNTDPTPAVYVWNVSAADPGPDSTPPQATITAAPANPTSSRTATFRFRASDNGTPGPDLRYECRLDSAAFAPCTSPVTYTGLSLGTHAFEVKARDAQLNWSAVVRHTWLIQPEPPDTNMPETRIDAKPDLHTIETNAELRFSSDEAGSTFECSLDAAAFDDCSSPLLLSGLARTQHTFRVQAIDPAGNVDPTPASYTWTIGAAAVERTVSCGQTLTTSTRVLNDLDNCLGDGLIVGAPNITIDLNERTIGGSGLSAGIRNNGHDGVTITGNGRLTEFDHGIALNAGTAGNIVSGVIVELNQEAGIQLSNADEGGEGNLIRNSLVTNNSHAGIAVTAGTQHTRLIGNEVGGNPASGVYVSGSSDTHISDNRITASSESGVLMEGATATTIVANTITGNSGEPVSMTLGSSGNRVEANDISGNSKGIVLEGANGNEIVDNTIIETSDTAVSLSLSNDNLIARNAVNVNSGGVELYQSNRNRVVENETNENSGSGIAVGDQSYNNVLRLNSVERNDSDGISIEAETPAGAGTLIDRNQVHENGSDGISINKIGHTVVGNRADDNEGWGIYATVATSLGMNVDGGGNRAENNKEPAQCFMVRCDGGNPVLETMPPETSITDGPPETTPSESATFEFSGTDNSLLELEFECRLDGAVWQACASPHSVDGISDGDHVFEVRAVDPAGNRDPSPARHEWERAPLPPGVPPETTIDRAPDRVTVQTTASFAFSSNEPGTTFECNLDGAGWVPCDPPQVYDGLDAGNHDVAVRAVDSEGLRDGTPATHAWTIGPAPVAAAVSCGQVVTQSIRVTNSLSDCPADGLVVGAANITVDLDGQTIDGVGVGTGVRNPQFDGVTIANGLVQEFERGVAVDPSAHGVVTGMTVQLNAASGIELAGVDGAVVRDSSATANGAGIALLGGSTGSVVRGTTVTANLGDGIAARETGDVLIEDNAVTGSEAAGIALEDSVDAVVVHNALSGNSLGIAASLGSHRGVFEENTVSAGDDGIRVAESATARIVDNVVEQISGAGITLDAAGDAVVRRNDLRFNGDGIALADSSGASVSSNDASGTSGNGITVDGDSFNNVIARNTTGSNGSEGISIDGVAPSGQGNLIDRNTAMSNGSDGIIVSGTGHTIVANAAYMNDGWGMYAEPGNTDGGGNLAAGNVEPAQCFNIVCLPGDFVVPGLPDTTILEKPAEDSNSRMALFTFIGDDDTTPLEELSFECRLDGTDELDWVECDNPAEYGPLSAGPHRFEVRARDLSDNVDPEPARHDWTYTPPPTGVAPDTQIGLAPPDPTPLFDAVFTFSSNEPDVTYQCQLDSGPWETCELFFEHEFEEHEVGEHTFRVRAVDIEGHVDPSPDVHTWTISGLITTILSGPAYEPGENGQPANGGETEETTATFDFVANATEAEYECSIDLGPFVACSAPVAYTGLAVGEHSFRVTATDTDNQRVQLEPTEYEWEVLPVVDTTAPVVALTASPASGSMVPEFKFTATDDQSPVGLLDFECRLDSADVAAWYDCTGEGPLGGVVTHNLLTEFPELAPGPHQFQVRALDEAGNEGTPVSHSWTLAPDTVAPVTTFLSTPDTPSIEPDFAFEFAATDNATPELELVFECQLDGGVWEGCASPHDLSVEPGEHTLAVRAVDLAGNPGTPATFAFALIGEPDTVLDPGTLPADPTTSTAATFTFSSDQAGSTFECSLNGSPMAACESPLAIDVGGGGDYVFEVQATNPQGLVDGTPAIHEWTVNAPLDTAAPDTTITSAPVDGTTSSSALFEFEADQFGSTFECQIDGLGWNECVSPHELLELASADHVFEVRAVDPAGNADASPAVHEWTYDGPPLTTILAAPEGEVESTTAEFQFLSSDAGSTYECWLDGASAPCTSPQTYTGLGVGDHVFAVKATDPGGQVEVAWVEHEWTVVPIQAPQTSVTGGPASETALRSATFSFAADEPGSTFSCSLDGAAFAACDTPFEVTGLAPGAHELEVVATDVFGNTDASPASHEWTVVRIADVQTAIVVGPPARTIETVAGFSFTAGVAGLTFECSLDGAAFEPCQSPVELSALEPGDHVFEVRAVDEAGTPEPEPARREWEVVGAPETVIDTAPAVATTAPNAAFTFSSDQAASTFHCSIDRAEPAPCESPVSFTDVGGGTHTFEVYATNEFALVDETPAVHEWTVDGPPESTAPETVITAGPPAATDATSATFEFSGTDNMTQPLDLGFECSLDGGAWEPCASPHELADLPEGDRQLRVRAVDAAGNADQSPATRDWEVLDTTAPETTIDAGPDNPTSDTGAAFEFSSDEAGVTFACSLDGAAFAACSSPHAISGLTLGDHTLRVRARDAAGNTDSTPDTHAWTVEEPPDTTPPVTAISAGPPTSTTSPTATFAFTADEVVEGFECRLDLGAWAACDSPHVIDGLAVAAHRLDVRATDLEGNVDPDPVRFDWTVTDGTPPQTTIGAGAPPATTSSTNATFTFNADEAGSTFQCKLGAGAWAACTSPKGYSALAPGSHTFSVRATDAAGNTDPSPATHTWSVAAACTGSTATVGAAADSWVLQDSAGTNYGTDSSLKVNSKGPNQNSRVLVRFTMPAIPAGCQVTSAKLRMYSGSYKTGRTLQALRVDAAWTESAVRWNNQPATTGTAATVASGSGYREWTVTSIVQSQYTTANNGFLIRDAAENNGGMEQVFNSREKGTDNPPRLVLTFG